MSNVKLSHVSRMRSQYAYNRTQVLWLTSMTDEQLSEFQFETGMDWLVSYTNEDRAVLVTLLHEPMIWKWWLNEWNRRDALYYLSPLYKMKPTWRLAQYRSYHQNIFIPNYPPYTFLEDSYNKAIREWQKQVQSEKI